MFERPGDAYDSYMGRWSRRLAPLFADFAGVGPGMNVLDVGCGPGALMAELAARGTTVSGAEPSESFAAACADRVPDADVRVAPAERLPWPDGSFDAVLSQLVLNFLSDAPAGVREMARVVHPGGVVAACTWDYRGGMEMLRTFWDSALEVDPEALDEGRSMRYCNAEELAALWESAGLVELETRTLELEQPFESFDDYWLPFALGIGPAGAYYGSLEAAGREALRDACLRRLGTPDGPFTLTARAVAVRGLR